MTEATYTQDQMDAITFAAAQAAATAAAEYQEPTADEISNEFLFGYDRASDIKICVLDAVSKAIRQTKIDLGFVAVEYVD